MTGIMSNYTSTFRRRRPASDYIMLWENKLEEMMVSDLHKTELAMFTSAKRYLGTKPHWYITDPVTYILTFHRLFFSS